MDNDTTSMKEQGDTIHDQSGNPKGSNFSKYSHMISQSEEDESYMKSEHSNSVSDKKSRSRMGKRNLKAKRKDQTNSDDASSVGSDSKSKSTDAKKRKKKLDEYKNQVIIDQYGTFEYDKDPEGYKRARKRQQNRESALRARDKRVSKMESVETTLQRIRDKSDKFEKENLVLKAEKKQLQDQVQNLLSIITSFGQHKRFKTTDDTPNDSFRLTSVDNKSTDKEVLSDPLSEAKEQSLSNQELCEYKSVNLSPRGQSPERTMLKLIRKDKDSMFEQDSEESYYGDLFKKGMMLSLTIVMCMILCLTGFSLSNSVTNYNKDMCTSCAAPRNPFEFRSTDSKVLMSHPDEPHYDHEGHFETVASNEYLFTIWTSIFAFMVFSAFLFRKSIFALYKH